MIEEVLQFLYGALTVTCLVVGFFFLHYWHLQRDRFFLWFTVAFWAIGASWGGHLVLASPEESGPAVYVFRLVGFLLLIAGIVDKNRRVR